MAQENRENSVLFSLRELRDIEHTRVRSEEEQRLQVQEDERRRVDDERRRVEAERQRREQEERMRFDELERQRREEGLRLQEAERRAQIEAQAQLEQQRLAHEMELRRHEISKKRPTWLLAVVGVLVVLGGGLGVWGYQTYQERQAAQALAVEKERALADLERQRLELEAEIDKLNKEMEDAQTKLAAATTAAERDAAQKQLDTLRAEATRKQRDRKKVVDNASKQGSGGRKIEMSEACRKNPLDC
jgi:cell division protein FtsB